MSISSHLKTFALESLRRNFVVTDSSQPLLHQDFPVHHKFLIDCAQGQLIDPIFERKIGYISNGTISLVGKRPVNFSKIFF